MENTNIFVVKDCALITISTGRKAINLAELLDNLQLIPEASIYHHFWGGLLAPRFEEREFHNDFAGWVRHALREPELAERLAVIDPGEDRKMETIRRKLQEAIEERLDENESSRWMPAASQFEFLRGQLVVFDTLRRLEKPEDLATQIPKMSTSSIFYHFIDARSRLEDGGDDFRYWLATTRHDEQYLDLCAELASIDPYFSSLSQIRQTLSDVFAAYFPGEKS